MKKNLAILSLLSEVGGRRDKFLSLFLSGKLISRLSAVRSRVSRPLSRHVSNGESREAERARLADSITSRFWCRRHRHRHRHLHLACVRAVLMQRIFNSSPVEGRKGDQSQSVATPHSISPGLDRSPNCHPLSQRAPMSSPVQ